MQPVEIAFSISAAGGASPGYEVAITGGSFWKWQDAENNREIFIIGQWLGSYISGKVINTTSVSPLPPGVSPEELILGGFGQFIMIVSSADAVTIYTSKTMFSVHWADAGAGRYVFSSEPGHLRQHRQGKPTVNVLEIALQTEYFFSSPFDNIVEEIKLLAPGQRLEIRTNGNVTAAYLPELMRHRDWTIRDNPQQLPYLDAWVSVLKESPHINVALMLSGGIDSTALLFKLLKAGINVRPVVISQYYATHYSAMQEMVQGKLIADLAGISHELATADTHSDSIFGRGRNTGWKWGYAYFAKLLEYVEGSPDEWLFAHGLGDCMLGITHTGFRLCHPTRQLLRPSIPYLSGSLRFTANHMKQGFERFLYSELAARLCLLGQTKNSVNSAGSSRWHPLFISTFGAPDIPNPIQRSRRNLFRIFPQLEADLIAYRRETVAARLFPEATGTAPEDLIASFRIIRYYLHIAANIYPYGIYMSHPYVDALPWYARRPLSMKETLTGKYYQHRFFREATGQDFHRYVSRKRVNYPQLAAAELARIQTKPGADLGLMGQKWYDEEKFQGLLRETVKNDVYLLDALEAGPVRDFYEKLVTGVRNSTYTYSGNYPKHLVNFLRFEMFLRDIA